MSIEYILDRVGKKLGINPSDNHQRAIMLDYLNEAAQELYEESDMVGSLVEDSFYVQGNKTIALPSNVSSIRAIREKESKYPWKIANLTERYSRNNLEQDDRHESGSNRCNVYDNRNSYRICCGYFQSF